MSVDAPIELTLWRCDDCGKWSHAHRRPKHHVRYVDEFQAPADESRIIEWIANGIEHDTGAKVFVARIKCGPFAGYRCIRMPSELGSEEDDRA